MTNDNRRAWEAYKEEASRTYGGSNHIKEAADMTSGALAAIQELLDSGNIPRGTFADDQVRNLVAMYNTQQRVIARMREGLEFYQLIDDDLVNFTNGFSDKPKVDPHSKARQILADVEKME